MNPRVSCSKLPAVNWMLSLISDKFRSENSSVGDLFVVLPVFTIFISLILVLSSSPALSEGTEDPNSTVEGFNLYRYDEDLTWKLSGTKADRGGESLVVQGFHLVVKRSGVREEAVYELSGAEMGLNSAGKSEVAVIPGELKLTIDEKINGTAGNARYEFSTGRISGSRFSITREVEGDRVTLEGEKFEYEYRRKRLGVTGGFQATIDGSGGRKTKITGDELTWIQDEEISTQGNVVARTGSGWKLTSEEMRWNPGKEILICSGPVVAVRDDARVRGESLTYDQAGGEITVRKGEMTFKGK